MTGYLTAVAELALGHRAPSPISGADASPTPIQPRRVVTYEPWPAAPESSVEWYHAERGPRTDERPTRLAEDDVHRSVAPMVHDVNPARRSAHDAATPRAIDSARAVAPPVPESGQASEPASPMPAEGVARSAAVSGPPPLRPMRSVPHSPTVFEAPLARATTSATTSATTPRASAPDTSGISSVVEPARRSPEPLDVLPRRATSASIEGPRPSGRLDEQVPPVVVTIGRIEVRAVSAAAAPSTTRATRATMSLEDYLGERTRGLR